ncbi:MAG TPA: FliI/YscN family ATPase [Armatimonadota bacterium]|nr:FliI/YscN family ATPase [Armatimonadota bacterium]
MGAERCTRIRSRLLQADSIRRTGSVVQSIGIVIESEGPPARVGELCEVSAGEGHRVLAEVVGFRDRRLLMMPLGETRQIGSGSQVVATGRPMTVSVSEQVLGRVFDGLGRPMDGGPEPPPEGCLPVDASPPPAMQRQRITEPIALGVRVLDAVLTCGRGQRVGIFAGSGVGKSTLLGMIARNTAADVSVIALVGERGREVRDFVEGNLGPEGLKRSVVIASTSDQPPLVRLRAAQVATTIAEFFRDRGHNVLLMMDSITRVAWAQREVGLAAGEPPTRNGYTPSVFAMLPKLLERTGMAERGSITALYTILVEGDDMTEPVADAARSILDGHIVLSRNLAHQGHYPAVDVLESVSRLMPELVTDEHARKARRLCEAVAVYREHEDLINLGAYVSGSNADVDRAIALRPQIEAFLRQDAGERVGWDEALAQLSRTIELPREPSAPPEDRGERAAALRRRLPRAISSFHTTAGLGPSAPGEGNLPATNRDPR